MKVTLPAIGLLGALFALLVLIIAHQQDADAFPGDTTADRVWGQSASFTSNTCNLGGVSASSICTPDGVYIDAAQRMYVADRDNSRVLMYANTNNNGAAVKVFGQYNLFTVNLCNNGGINTQTLCQPGEITGDTAGNLYIADTLNSRVLEFDDPNGSCGTCDTVADRVFGQLGSFTTGIINKGGISANSLNYPVGVVTDPAGNLYVADRLNSRILEYDNPVGSCGTCDTIADRAFGQAGSFTTNIQNKNGISANSLSYLLGLGMDSANSLYVADEANNRALKYDTPLGSCGTCDTTADLVFGQLNLFTTNLMNNGGSTSATALYVTTDVAVDTAGNVFVSETGNERVVEFDQPASTDTIADVVFGQGGSFTASGNNSIGLNADSQADPWSLAFDIDCNLFVADYGNNRPLEYDAPPSACTIPPSPTPTATSTATATACPIAICTPTPTPTHTATPTETPTCVALPPACATATPTATPCSPAICTPTATPTCNPFIPPGCATATPTDTPTATPTCDPLLAPGCATATPTETPTPTPTPVPSCGGLPVTIFGTNGADLIVGTAGNDVISALAGNDMIFAGPGNDIVCAGPGNDTVNAAAGNDSLFGQAGFDFINGGAGSDSMNGGAGFDFCNGGPPLTDTQTLCESVTGVP